MAKNKTENTGEFINPFDPGINYDVFTSALNGMSVKDYCEGKLTAEQIEWLENDLKHYSKNK